MYGPRRKRNVVGVGGDDVFLDEELDAVGEGLQPAELAADAGGAEAVLDAAGDFPLGPDEDEGGDGDKGDEGHSRDQGDHYHPERRPKQIIHAIGPPIIENS